MKKNISGNIDRPIDNIKEDFLDRYKFVEYIYSILDNLPLNSNIRVGIEGPWGSGKSSMMKLLHDECKKSGHFTAYFNPWQFNDWNLAWSGLVSAIGKSLCEGKNGKLNPFKRKLYIKKGAENILRVLHLTKNIPYADIASKIGDLLISPLLSKLDETKQHVIDYLNVELGDKRMFMFIDDLDRANEQVMYNLLMFLNEVIDFNKIVYVVGLDIEVTKFTLKDRIKDVDNFLEKIINWSFKLPQPSEFDWNVYTGRQLESLMGGVKRENLLSLMNVLPRNPRKLKLFLYYLDGLHRGFLGRFDNDELHWDIVYLIQLLRIEFPKAFESILGNKILIEDLAYGTMREGIDRHSSQKRSNTQEEPKWKGLLKSNLPKEENAKIERLFKLYEAIRNSHKIMSDETMSYHLRVIDSPDLVTWKEYRSLKRKLWDSPEDKLYDKVKEVMFSNTSYKAVIWQREFLNTLLMDRNKIFEDAIQRKSDPEIQSELKQVFTLNKICKLTFEIDDLFIGDNPVYNIDLFKAYVEKFKQWAHFNRPEHLYKKLRDDEKGILLTLTSKMKPWASELLIVLGIGRYEPHFSDGPDGAFAPVKNEMIKILSDSLVESLLNRFEQFDGINRLWPSNENKTSELNILFDPKSSFHNSSIYEKLNETVSKISEKPCIRDNFYEYTSMLFHAALNPTSFSTTEKARDLLKKKDFISIIWDGTIGKGLNLRNVGSLQDYREKLRKICDVDDLLPLPEWWDKVLKGEQVK